MDNRDWKISDNEATKFFSLGNDTAVDRFIREVHKLAQKEDHTIRLRRMKDSEVRVKVPVASPGNFSEAEVRLLNLINKLAK